MRKKKGHSPEKDRPDPDSFYHEFANLRFFLKKIKNGVKKREAAKDGRDEGQGGGKEGRPKMAATRDTGEGKKGGHGWPRRGHGKKGCVRSRGIDLTHPLGLYT